MDDKNLRTYFAELVGTFAFVFISAGAILASALGGLQPPSVAIALATGFMYAVVLAITLPISGGFLNPAIVVTLWVFRRMSGMRAVGLICSQLLGAVLAGLLLRVFPFREDVFTVTRLGTPHLNLTAFAVSGISMATLVKGIAIEGALTFLLMFAAIAVTLDPRASRWLGSWASRTPALWLGLILVALTIVGFPLTGAALNPARWLGPVIAEFTVEPLQMQKPFADNPIYWIGPTAGALLAGWVYNALVLTPEEEDAVPGVMLPGGTPTLASARVRK